MPRNPFTVLGLPLDATTETIKAAWRRLARENHPDVTSGDPVTEKRATRAMAEINAAYSDLRDPQKRRTYRAAAVKEARANGRYNAAREAAAAADRAAAADWAEAEAREGMGPNGPNVHGGNGGGDGRGPEGWPGSFGDAPFAGGHPAGWGSVHPTRPVTARIDTSELLRPRNAVLHPTGRSPLPGLRPRPRNAQLREPPRASTPSGPTSVRPGPNLDTELPNLATALDTPLRFGKFAGLTLGDVAEIEPTYIDWIVRTIDRDPELTLAARVVLRDLERSGLIRRPRYDAANPNG